MLGPVSLQTEQTVVGDLLTITHVLAIIQILLTVPIAIYVAMASRAFSLSQGEREVRNAWLDFDLAVLANDDLLEVADSKLHGASQPMRWRWICYAVRNPLENFYTAMARRHRFWWSRPICRDPAFFSLKTCLDQMVHDPEFMDVVHGFSADERFLRLCYAIADNHQCDYLPPETTRRLRDKRVPWHRHRCQVERKLQPSITAGDMRNAARNAAPRWQARTTEHAEMASELTPPGRVTDRRPEAASAVQARRSRWMRSNRLPR